MPLDLRKYKNYAQYLESYLIKFNQDFDSKILSNSKVLITLVGLSPLPLAMNIDVLKPKKVYFLYSDKSIKETYVIKELVKHKEFKEMRMRIEEDKVEDLYNKILQIAKHEGEKNVIIDITGGKKLMVAGAVSAANLLNINYIYTDFTKYDPKTRLPIPNSEYLHFIKNFGNFHTTLSTKSGKESDYLDMSIIYRENSGYINFILNDPNIILTKAVNKTLFSQLLRGFSGINFFNKNKIKDELKSYSGFILKYFIPKEVVKILNSSEKENIRINLSEDILEVPWEIINFSKALKKKKIFFRKILSSSLPRIRNISKSQEIKKVSILANLDGTLPGAQAEGEMLKEFFETVPGFEVSFYSGVNNSPGIFKIFEILEESDLVHFAGHGFKKEGNELKTGWKLKDDFMHGELFSDIENPPCMIFSNSCFGGKTCKTGNKVTRDNMLVSGLLDAGVKCFIISPIGIPDNNNPKEIIGFYRKFLLEKTPVTRAYRETIGNTKENYLYQFYGELENNKEKV